MVHANDLEPLFPSLLLRGVGIPRPNRRERASIVARASIEMRHEIDHRERSLGVRDAHDDECLSLSRSARSNASFRGRANARGEMATVGEGCAREASGVVDAPNATRAMRGARREVERWMRKNVFHRVASSSSGAKEVMWYVSSSSTLRRYAPARVQRATAAHMVALQEQQAALLAELVALRQQMSK